jgi:hypothetical protein
MRPRTFSTAPSGPPFSRATAARGGRPRRSCGPPPPSGWEDAGGRLVDHARARSVRLGRGAPVTYGANAASLLAAERSERRLLFGLAVPALLLVGALLGPAGRRAFHPVRSADRRLARVRALRAAARERLEPRQLAHDARGLRRDHAGLRAARLPLRLSDVAGPGPGFAP